MFNVHYETQQLDRNTGHCCEMSPRARYLRLAALLAALCTAALLLRFRALGSSLGLAVRELEQLHSQG